MRAAGRVGVLSGREIDRSDTGRSRGYRVLRLGEWYDWNSGSGWQYLRGTHGCHIGPGYSCN